MRSFSALPANHPANKLTVKKLISSENLKVYFFEGYNS